MRAILRPRSVVLGFVTGALLCTGSSCASSGAPPPESYAFFETPDPRDPWSPKISGWQARESALEDIETLRAPAPVSDPGSRPIRRDIASVGDLRAKYFSFRSERKRALAAEVAAWIQEQARLHYVPDGPLDHWATLEETLAGNGDDCDGLELLTYHILRDLGFRQDEVYRAIVYRPADGQHHMVTLWFETVGEPRVIDPTGAMSEGMPRLSEVPGWVPLKVFSESEEYTVRSRPAAGTSPLLASGAGLPPHRPADPPR